MSEPYYQDGSVCLWLGDALRVMEGMPESSVDCVVTSPPYYGLRDYGVDGQIGLEPTPDEYVDRLAAVIHETARVLKPDGTLWLVLGDSYASSPSPDRGDHSQMRGRKHAHAQTETACRLKKFDRPRKSLLGIPWRVAFRLQDDGWILRSEIIWHKHNSMPESVRDRPTRAHETVFLLSRGEHYYYDADAVRQPLADSSVRRLSQDVAAQHGSDRLPGKDNGPMKAVGSALGRNLRDVWDINTTPFTGAHFAVFPEALPATCITAGCRPGGVVLDPFSGSGTTGLAALKAGCRYVGIDISRDYLDLSLHTRFAQGTLEAVS